MTMMEFMEIMEITRVVFIKSLWWIIPTVGGVIIMAIMEWKEEHE